MTAIELQLIWMKAGMPATGVIDRDMKLEKLIAVVDSLHTEHGELRKAVAISLGHIRGLRWESAVVELQSALDDSAPVDGGQ